MAHPDTSVSMECHENGVEGIRSLDRSFTEVIIVRHGETYWNALGKMQGQADIDLNEVGRQQAAAVADRLSRESDITAVYTSDLRRALETADIIASRCHGLEVIKEEDLRERHIGDLQGLVFSELAELNPDAYKALKSQKLDQGIPGGGETRGQLYKRCTSSLERIAEKHRGQRVIVVTHGVVIETMYKRALPGYHEGIPNASIGIIQLCGDVWSIKSWNDVSHLKETGYIESAFGGDGSSC